MLRVLVEGQAAVLAQRQPAIELPRGVAGDREDHDAVRERPHCQAPVLRVHRNLRPEVVGVQVHGRILGREEEVLPAGAGRAELRAVLEDGKVPGAAQNQREVVWAAGGGPERRDRLRTAVQRHLVVKDQLVRLPLDVVDLQAIALAQDQVGGVPGREGREEGRIDHRGLRQLLEHGEAHGPTQAQASRASLTAAASAPQAAQPGLASFST
mmetsp:Transcript_35032/g.104083  ORF Transcript_35032/g.104083 Transcript_35032/m.104083 type:complete len:211 (+) Transcript_35032:1261-1893(+)